MTGQRLWDYLKDNKKEIINGRMIVDTFSFDDIRSQVDDGSMPEAEMTSHILKIIDSINRNIDGEIGVNWGVISDHDSLHREKRDGKSS